jgi:hypothetical protein
MRTKLVAFGSVPIRLLSVLVMWGMIATGVHAQLAHRYSFTANANDSVGTAHGTPMDAGVTPNFSFTGGALDFSANTGETSNAITEGAYLDLPNNIVSAAATAGMNGAVAFEWWYTLSESRTWQRVGDFGNSNTGEDTSGSGSATDYLSVVATSGRGNQVDMTNHTNTGFEPAVGLTGTATLGTPYHVLAVYNHNDKLAFTAQGSNGTMTLYVNGARIGTAAIHPDIDIRTMDDVNNWLGRSQWGDPLFDGSYDEFRIYNTAPAASYATASFNAGPNALAPFVPWVEEFDLEFTVNRDTGTFSLSNSAAGSINVAGISISTPSGSIDGTKWLSVTNNYDSDSGVVSERFDTDNTWSITSNTTTLLSEVEVVGDGGQLGAGGTQQTIQLGDDGAWRLSRYEDLVVNIDRLMPDFSIQVIPVRVNYVGGIGAAAARTDLDFDGDTDSDDWVEFASNHFDTFPGLTRAQSAPFGDMDGDLDNDYADFLLFQADYDQINGLGALALAMSTVSVPEPSSAILLLFGSCAVAFRRRKSLQRGDFSMNENQSSQLKAPLCKRIVTVAVMALGVMLCASQADAQIVNTFPYSQVITTTPETLSGSLSIPYTLQNSGNALVVGTYIDNTHTVSNMLYAGAAPAIPAIVNDRMNMFYFESPAATGNFTFNYTVASSNNPNFAFMLLELSGVDLNAAVDTGTGATITTTVPDQFIVSMAGLNNADGSVLTAAAGSLLTIQGVANANGAIGGGAVGAGYVDARDSDIAGVKQVGFNNNAAGFFQGQASIALRADPLLVDLTLVVNKTTGQASIRNDSDSVMSFDYYRIESPGNALDLAGWNSLDDQNIGSLPADFNGNGSVGGTDLPIWQAGYGTNANGDADGDGDSDGRDFLLWQRSFGQAPSVTQSWIEAGGSTTAAIGELLLNGATSIGPGQSISLGAAYNEAIFGANDGDLVFNVSLGGSAQLQEGAVEYVTGAITAVPEPTSLAMCSLALVSLMWRRR